MGSKPRKGRQKLEPGAHPLWKIELPKQMLETTLSFFDAIATTIPEACWIRDFTRRPVSEDPTVKVLVPPDMFFFLNTVRTMAGWWDELGTEHASRMVHHFGKSLPAHVEWGDKLDLSKTVSTAYECIVFARCCAAGYDPHFLPQEKGATPDIRILNPPLLIECKDAKTVFSSTTSAADLIRKLQDLIEDGESQLQRYDPQNIFEQYVCVDLPEFARYHLSALSDKELEDFWRDLFGYMRITSSGDAFKSHSRIKKPEAVLLSNFEWTFKGEYTEGQVAPEPVWILPLFKPSSGEHPEFVSRFFAAREQVARKLSDFT